MAMVLGETFSIEEIKINLKIDVSLVKVQVKSNSIIFSAYKAIIWITMK